jgi:hypothetical protein
MPGAGTGTANGMSSEKDIKSAKDHEDRPGQSLVTQDHEVIQQWAKERGARPATVPGTEHQGHLGVLRFIFTDDSDSRLEEVSWDDWFKAFDARSLLFHFQEHKKDGQESNFFKLENPND